MANLVAEDIIRNMQEKLGKVFDDRDHVFLIAKSFRVFPSFFNQEILSRMLDSKD